LESEPALQLLKQYQSLIRIDHFSQSRNQRGGNESHATNPKHDTHNMKGASQSKINEIFHNHFYLQAESRLGIPVYYKVKKQRKLSGKDHQVLEDRSGVLYSSRLAHQHQQMVVLISQQKREIRNVTT
jgi:hypothetical protein